MIRYKVLHFLHRSVPEMISPFSSFSTLSSNSALHVGQQRIPKRSFFIVNTTLMQYRAIYLNDLRDALSFFFSDLHPT